MEYGALLGTGGTIRSLVLPSRIADSRADTIPTLSRSGGTE